MSKENYKRLTSLCYEIINDHGLEKDSETITTQFKRVLHCSHNLANRFNIPFSTATQHIEAYYRQIRTVVRGVDHATMKAVGDTQYFVSSPSKPEDFKKAKYILVSEHFVPISVFPGHFFVKDTQSIRFYQLVLDDPKLKRKKWVQEMKKAKKECEEKKNAAILAKSNRSPN